jgi:hypothetical protein
MNNNIDAPIGSLVGLSATSKISEALSVLQPNQRRRKHKEFAAHYDAIESHIANGVSLKDIRAALAEGGLPMSAATFKKMLEAERARRAKALEVSAEEDRGAL